jgi:type 1 glutamine amidotransferase
MRGFWALVVLMATSFAAFGDDPWIVYPGGEGPGKGKHIVLISGDEEYRSEEAMPMLGKLLAERHGFKCTVLFAIDPKTGTIQPNITDNIPGLESLKTADLMVVFLRWRTIPDEQMKHINDYLEAGKPVIGLRTSTHAFKPGRKGPYAMMVSDSKAPGFEGGFGKAILGETWVNHHGAHGKEGTRGIVTEAGAKSPILNGIDKDSIFATSDVYTVKLPLPGDSVPLVLGAVTETLQFDSKAVIGKKNDPMMPVAWTKTYTMNGKTGQVFTTTMGASQDLAFEGTRRLVVNACFWGTGLEVPKKANVEVVGDYKPSPFKFRKDAEWLPAKTPAQVK